jgi:hypothetical protein
MNDFCDRVQRTLADCFQNPWWVIALWNLSWFAAAWIAGTYRH